MSRSQESVLEAGEATGLGTPDNLRRMSLECHIETNKRWFRLRACGLIVRDNEVLMMGNDVDPYRYSVGGGVLVGESTYDAAIREVWEETGVKLPVERLAIIHENYFFSQHNDAMHGLESHELAFYYLGLV